jgi:hypothetical protein
VIDPKGDAELMLRAGRSSPRWARKQLLPLSPRLPGNLCPIQRHRQLRTHHRSGDAATNALPSGGNSAAFKEFSWRFTNIVAQAQVALGRIPTYETLLRDVTGIEPLFMDYAHMVFRHAARGEFTNYQARLDAIRTWCRPKIPRFR